MRIQHKSSSRIHSLSNRVQLPFSINTPYKGDYTTGFTSGIAIAYTLERFSLIEFKPWDVPLSKISKAIANRRFYWNIVKIIDIESGAVCSLKEYQELSPIEKLQLRQLFEIVIQCKCGKRKREPMRLMGKKIPCPRCYFYCRIPLIRGKRKAVK